MTDSWNAHRVVPSLDLDDIPRGAKMPLLVELTHDGLGRPIHLPLLVARGTRRGPVFGVTAAVHGNELNGIAVIHRLFDQIDPSQLRGTIVGVLVVNVPSFLAHERQFPEGEDLNRTFPGSAEGNAAQVYVHRLTERILRRFDRLADLHTASFGRVNSLYVRTDMTNPATARMAYLQRPQIIVHIPATDHTLRGTAMELGIPAIAVEIADPHRFQLRYIRSSLVGLRSLIADVGMLPRRAIAPGPPPVVCKSSRWIYADHGGLLEVLPDVTDRVKKGQVIAQLRTIFGEPIREYRAPDDGIVIGKSVNPVGSTGARILHLGFEAEPGLFEPRHADIGGSDPELPAMRGDGDSGDPSTGSG